VRWIDYFCVELTLFCTVSGGPLHCVCKKKILSCILCNSVKFDFRSELNSLSSNTTSFHPLRNRTVKSLKFWEKRSQNSPHNGFFCFSFSCNFIDCFFKRTLKYDWWFCLVFLAHWLWKSCDLEQKIVLFVNGSHCWQPVRLQVIFVDVIKRLMFAFPTSNKQLRQASASHEPQKCLRY